ncbi:MAG: biopolymer transporter ExbD [Candidatus Gastranaerophilales bacterium]|nr:biopolymer transporter ExbD [Candidatus Gastranaerophilales bacterium]
MSIKTAKGKDALFTEINITPLTDIFLVLLIIMMVVAPTFQSMDNSIKIPEINSGVAVEVKNATVSVTKEGLMYINGKQIKPEDLTNELVAIRDSLEKKEVVVKADEKAKSSEIMRIMDSAKEAEFTKLVLAGEPLSKREQKKLQTQTQQPQEKQESKNSDWVE